MEMPIYFSDEPTVTDSLIVKDQIGKGKFSVFKCDSPTKKKQFALKIFPKDSYGTPQFENEKLMFHLDHQNIIENIPVRDQDNRFHLLLTEFAKYGDFFHLVTGNVFDKEQQIRTYFQQLVEGLEYMHSEGIAHLDIKLENLMMGEDFQLKIIDFDQCQPISDCIINSGGTSGYRAPEVLSGECEDLAAADIYSLGVVLFAFKSKEFPFMEMEDPEAADVRSYNTFKKKNAAFWKARAEIKGNSQFFSNDFMKLVNGCLHPNPEKRWTLEDVKASAWYNGPAIKPEKLASEMKGKLDRYLAKKK